MADSDLTSNTSEETTGTETSTTKMAKKVTGILASAALTLKVESNPKRPGGASFDRFEGYFKDGVDTVEAALANGLTMGDIKYDVVHGFIEVEGAEIEEYEVASRGPRAKKDPDLEGETATDEGLLDTSSEEDNEEALFG